MPGVAPREPRIDPFLRLPAGAFGKPVCRLGLASRGDGALTVDDIHHALGRGVDFLNWPGTDDALARAVAGLGSRREGVVVCVQLEARTAAEAARELKGMLATLNTDHIDVLTFYYVEAPEEWRQLAGSGGALEYCRQAQRDGVVRRLGLTTHQRPLAAEVARNGLLDLLMIRYNAAHRGAEGEVFPATDAAEMPVIAYTALRWGALLRPTSDDPPGFVVPTAPSWYRWVLQSPSVAVALTAPHDRAELEEDLTVLDARGPLSPEEYERLADHGQRVRRHAGGFP
ncbi:MAG TPA: aldo/keto reductase [Isosphaeraceae bacterium]|jgi:predicted aldo/keto reductase-like oxidoreductase|nr:aldo/keto reductase [Isosphaeraceae bacterium]